MYSLVPCHLSVTFAWRTDDVIPILQISTAELGWFKNIAQGDTASTAICIIWTEIYLITKLVSLIIGLNLLLEYMAACLLKPSLF